MAGEVTGDRDKEENGVIVFNGQITRIRVEGFWRKVAQFLNGMRYRWEVGREGTLIRVHGFTLTKERARKHGERAARELLMREKEQAETFTLREDEL